MKPLSFFTFLFIGLALSACMASKHNQVFHQTTQRQNERDPVSDVVRIYMDKFGYYYPDASIMIDSTALFSGASNSHYDTDTTNGNLYYYYKKPERLKPLREFYKVPDYGSDKMNKTYYEIEDIIIKEYTDIIKKKIAQQNAEQVVFLIHGFNVDHATEGFQAMRDYIQKNGYDKNNRNVYVEIFWDGAKNLSKKPLSAIPIWKYGQNNSIYVGLSVRKLLMQLDKETPLVFFTHSLGASVATEALFNTTRKWSGAPNAADAAELVRLLKTPTPDSHRIRLGMIAPAVPGESTFKDFNRRSPTDITASKNNIYPIVIGYNPKDYAVSKAFLARYFGTTTLGTNGRQKNQSEIYRVKRVLIDSLHYDELLVNTMIDSVHFNTKRMALVLQDHAIISYLDFNAETTRAFFRKLFGE